ncbi:hypothetical protein [Streptomyces sp. NPDC020298]|uniref:hypothetical protein n=1 Tax=unclassified Streptomyces TaxID=2593676 RepID=UPI0033F4EBD3
MRNWTTPAGGTGATITLAAALAVLVTGCAGGTTGGNTDGKGREAGGTWPAVATSFAHAPQDYPLDAYRPTIAETGTVDHAVVVLARSCMRKFGQSWPAYQAPPGSIPLNARKYGPTDLASVRVYGYKPPLPDGVTRQQAVAAQQRAAATEKTITPAAKAVFTGAATEGAKVPSGVPEGGCRGQAQRSARADGAADDLMEVQTLFVQASRGTAKDPATVALDKRWSACMRKAGLDYPDPLTAVDDSTWREQKTSAYGPQPAFPAPSRKEISTAEADVRCKAETGYVAKRYAVEARRQRQLVKEHRTALASVLERKRRMVERADTVVAADKAK